MDQVSYIDQVFKDLAPGQEELKPGTYENCEFHDCQFVGMDLSGYRFVDCSFVNCNLSNISTIDTAIRNVHFSGCKMLGVHFEDCHPFLFKISGKESAFDLSTFAGMELKGTLFRDCSLKDVDFTGAVLSGGAFEQCDLMDATFENTNLEGADFRTALNFRIDPQINQIKGARFSLPEVLTLLRHYQIIIE